MKIDSALFTSAPAATGKKRIQRRRPQPMALEPRFMFDGAAVATAVDAVATDTAAHDGDAATRSIDQTLRAAVEAAPAAVPSDTTGARHEIVFIDTSVPNWQTLAGAARNGVEVVLLDPARDAFQQMADKLSTMHDIDAIHLISHGAEGELIIGGRTYQAGSLSNHAAALATIGQSLSAGGDVLLYGCDVGHGSSGDALISAIAQATHADVAASIDATGATAPWNGNWVLEKQTGEITTTLFASIASLQQFDGKLATVSLTGNGGWTAIMYGSGKDPQGDSQAGAADTDIVGDASHGSLYAAFDDNGTVTTADDTVVFRMRIDNPTSTTNFAGVAIVGMDANLDGRVDIFMSVDGRNNGQAIRLFDPGTGANLSPSTTSTAPLPIGWLPNNGVYAFSAANYAVAGVSALNDPHWNGNTDLGNAGGQDVFISWRIPIADLATVLAKASPVDRNGIYGPRGATGIAGYNANTTVQYVSFTQTQTGPINGDLNGVGASYDKNATFASLGTFTAPMSASNPLSASLNVTISEPIGDGKLSATEDASVTVSGTSAAGVANGSWVKVTVTDGASNVVGYTQVTGAAWSLSGQNFSALNDGTLTATAELWTTGDNTGSKLTGSSGDDASVLHDRIAPVIAVNAVATSGFPTISGTSDLPAGSLISVTFDTDNNSVTANVVYLVAVQAGGGWSVNTALAAPSSGTPPTGGYSAYTKVTASGSDAAGNTGSAAAITTPTVNAVTTQSITPTLSGAWNYTAGDTLTVTVSGATYTLAPSGNSWTLDLSSATPSSGSLTPLVAGHAPYDVTATVTRNGVPVSDSSSGELTIASGPSVDITSNGGATTGTTSSTNPVVSGTATPGAVVTLRIDLDNNNATTGDRVTYSVVANSTTGAWSVNTATATPISGTLPSTGLSSTVGMLATVTDSNNRTATDVQVLTITTPTISVYSISGALPVSAPTAIATDGIVNGTEDDAVVIYLAAANIATSDTIALTVSDGVHANVTGTAIYEAGTGRWKATMNLSSLNDGTNALAVAASFNAGQATASTTLSHDSKAYATVASGEINSTTPTVSGTADVTAASLNIKVDRYIKNGAGFTFDSTSNFTTSTATPVTFVNGAWNFTLPQAGGVFNNTGEYALITVTGTDAAGNASSATGQLTKIANGGGSTPSTVTIGTIAGDNIINEAEDDSVTVSGTTSVSGGYVLVTLTDGTTSISQQVQAGTSPAGGPYSWSLTGRNLDTWKDGTVQVEAKLLSASGSTTVLAAHQLAPTHTNTVTALPAIAITSPIGDGNLSGTEDNSVLIRGTAVNAVGQTVTVTVSDGNAATIDPSTTTTVQADGTWSVSGVNLHGLDEVQLTATATVSTATASATVLHDKTAPVITVTALATAGTPIIAGTVTGLSPGSTITVTIDPDNDGSIVADGLTYTATVRADNSWSIDTANATPGGHAFPVTGLTAYAKISADATDAAGNAAITVIALDKPAVNSQTTNSTTPTLTGTWANIGGDVLTVTVNAVTYTAGDGKLSTSGNVWTLVVPAGNALTANTYSVTATATRGGLNTSDSTSSELIVDTSAPAVAITAISADTGTAADFITSDQTLIFSGTAEANANVLVTLKNAANATVFSTTIVATGGTWSLDRNGQTALESGTYTLTARATDSAGNQATATQGITIDITGPAIGITSNARTASTTPIITGTTDLIAGSTITVVIDPDNNPATNNSNTYTAVVQTGGTWSIDTGAPTANGGTGPTVTYTVGTTLGIRASGSDAAGNTSNADKTMAISSTAPSIGVTTPVDWNNGNSNNTLDNVEDDAVIIRGVTTGIPTGTTVTVTITDGSITITDTAIVQSNGSWTLAALNLSSMANGQISVTAQVIDTTDGSVYSGLAGVTHDKTATVAIDSISQDTGTPGDFITRANTISITGSATANAAVTVLVKDHLGVTVQTFNVTANASGAWSTTATGALAVDNYTIEATVGVTTATKAMTIVDATAPILTSSTPVDNATGIAVANDITLTFSKNIHAGAGFVSLYKADGTLVENFNVATGIGDAAGTITFNGTTGVTINPQANLLGGTSYYLKIANSSVLDNGGNAYAGISDATTLNFTTVVPDTTAPAAPGLTLTAASDSGASNSDRITSNNTPVLRVSLNGAGATAPVVGDVVKIYEGVTQVGSATLVNADIVAGYVDITTGTLGTDGAKSLTATVTDAAANVSTASAPLAVTLDTVAPVIASAAVNGTTLVLTYTDLANLDATGIAATGAFSVSAAGSAVTVNNVVVNAAARTVTLTLASAVTAGQTVTVNYTDPTGGNDASATQDIAGNDAASLVGQAVTNNTGAIAPTTTAAIASMTKDSGSSATDFLTNDGSATRTVLGTISAALGVNEVVQVSFDGGGSWTTATTGGTNWSIVDNGAHGAGWTIQARVTNTVSSLSAAAASQIITLDATAPATPALTLTAASDSGASNSDRITSNNTPVLRVSLNGAGATAPVVGDVVKIYEGVTQVGSATLVNADIVAGYVDITTGTLGTDGVKSLTATVTDAAANVSTASAALAVTLDTVAPVIASAAVNGTTLVLTYTDLANLDATGIAATGAFSVSAAGSAVTVNSVVVNAAARTVTLTLASAVTAGQTVTVSYTDPTGGNDASATQDIAGNDAASLVGQAVTNNTGAIAPTTTATIGSMTKDSGSSATDFLTNDGSATRTVSGTISAALGVNEVVQVSFDGGGSWTTATTGGTNWSIVDNGAHGAGWTIQARVTNTVSSLSAAAASRSITLDTVAPTVVITGISDDTGTPGDYMTGDATLVFAGSNESGATVAVTLDSVSLGSATVAGAGWTYNHSGATLSQGSHALSVTATDAAGNTATATRSILVDTTAPLLSSAAVNGSTLVLTYAETGTGMDGSAPVASDFIVQVNNVARSVSSIAVDAASRTVTLTLASSVLGTDVVTIGYVAGPGKVQDIAGNMAAGFSGRAVGNSTVVVAPAPVNPPAMNLAPVTNTAPVPHSTPGPLLALPPTDATQPAAIIVTDPQPVDAPISIIDIKTDSPLSSGATISGGLESIRSVSNPFFNGSDISDRLGKSSADIGNIVTSRGENAFQITVTKASEPGLMRFRGIPDQDFIVSGTIAVQVPIDAFVHTDAKAIVQLSARMANGEPLPKWLRFDAVTGKFSGESPSGLEEKLAIVVEARDAEGRRAEAMFHIKLLAKRPAGRAGLSEQFRFAARHPDALKSTQVERIQGKKAA